MEANSQEDKIIKCPHPSHNCSIRFGEEITLLLCQWCYEDIESNVVTEFISRVIRQGIQEGMSKAVRYGRKVV